MRIRRRRFGLYVFLMLLAGLVATAYYFYDVTFNQKWRHAISLQLARYGLGADIAGLTIDPVEGLTARKVRLFSLEHQTTTLAEISRLSMDIDLTQLLNKEVVLRSLTLQNASLSVPVDAGDPASEWIDLKDLNARLVIDRQSVQIAQADAFFAGIHLRLHGSIQRPAPKDEPPEDERVVSARRTRQWKEMRAPSGMLRSILRVIERFTLPVATGNDSPVSKYKAELDLTVSGEVTSLEKLHLSATLVGGRLNCGKFHAHEFNAAASLADGELTLHRFTLRDDHGSLTASASWPIRRSNAIALAVDSSTDLAALLKGVLPDISLPDDLTFASPPSFKAAGTLLAGAPFTLANPPINITGALDLGGFAVKGEEFSSFKTDFAVREDGFFYLRNTRLRHPTGEMNGQFLNSSDEVRYQFHHDMSILPLLKLAENDAIKKMLTVVEFSSKTHLKLDASGSRTQGETAGAWQHNGKIDLRDAKLRGGAIRQITAEATILAGATIGITVRNVLLRREDGDLTARTVSYNVTDGLIGLSGAVCTAPPGRAVALFSPKIGEAIDRYQFETAPRAEVDGVIDLRVPLRTDIRIRANVNGIGTAPVGNERLSFSGANGTVRISNGILSLDLSGRTVPGLRASVVRFAGASPLRIAGDFGLLLDNRISATRYTVRVLSPENVVHVMLAGREFPMEELDATLRCEAGRLAINANGRMFSGRVGVTLDFPNVTQGAHSGVVAIDRTGFGRLSSLMGSTNNTGGSLSARFSYQMPDITAESIEGSGTATLEDGNVFSLPLLGPLSGVINTLLPGDKIAYSVARKASASFSVKQGNVTTPDFEASTRTFKLSASGTADLIKDRVDFIARVNLRGVPGLLLYPVSKIFEYEADGTLNAPGWHARLLPRPFRKDSDNPVQ